MRLLKKVSKVVGILGLLAASNSAYAAMETVMTCFGFKDEPMHISIKVDAEAETGLGEFSGFETIADGPINTLEHAMVGAGDAVDEESGAVIKQFAFELAAGPATIHTVVAAIELSPDSDLFFGQIDMKSVNNETGEEIVVLNPEEATGWCALK